MAPSSFMNAISRAPGAKFPPEAGRYHLYVSHSCPWANRCLIMRNLKGLQDVISIEETLPILDGAVGWELPKPDLVHGERFLRTIYKKYDPNFTGACSVPLLVDRKTHAIVSNDSGDITRFLDTEFDDLVDPQYRVSYYPEELREEIDHHNDWILKHLNSTTYRPVFVKTQEEYDETIELVFEGLDKAEETLKQSGGPYLLGKVLTEADVRLYPTVVRMDPVYHHMCMLNKAMVRYDYPVLHQWLRHMYWNHPAVKEATKPDIILENAFKGHPKILPRGFLPAGPRPFVMPL